MREGGEMAQQRQSDDRDRDEKREKRKERKQVMIGADQRKKDGELS